MKRKVFYFLTILLVCTSSCSDELDFSQSDNLEITPTFESSIIYIESTEQIINLIDGPEVLSQSFNFDAFSSDVFAERVIEGELTYIIENTTSKPFELIIEFLDEADAVIDTEIFNIQSAPTSILQTIVAYGDSGKSIDIIRTLSALRITARNLGDNTSVSSMQNPRISLQSSGKFRVRLK